MPGEASQETLLGKVGRITVRGEVMSDEPVLPRKVPAPGRPVRGSRTGRPVMALLDLLGRRWTLRLLWELRDGPLRFVALRKAAGGVSQSVLVVRLAELGDAGIVEEAAEGYALTARGRELTAQLVKLDRWAQEWAADLDRR